MIITYYDDIAWSVLSLELATSSLSISKNDTRVLYEYVNIYSYII